MCEDLHSSYILIEQTLEITQSLLRSEKTSELWHFCKTDDDPTTERNQLFAN